MVIPVTTVVVTARIRPRRRSAMKSASTAIPMNGAAVCFANSDAASRTPAITAAGVDARARQVAHRPRVTRPSQTLSMRTRSYQAPVGAKAAADTATPPWASARGTPASRRNA
jgi:hypothetical protein